MVAADVEPAPRRGGIDGVEVLEVLPHVLFVTVIADHVDKVVVLEAFPKIRGRILDAIAELSEPVWKVDEHI